VEPRIELNGEDIYVIVNDGRSANLLLDKKEQVPGDGWPGKLVMNTDGQCPSVSADMVGDRISDLSVILNKIKALDEPCFTSRITATSGVIFSDLFATIHFLQTNRAFGHVILEAPLDKSSWDDECEAGMVLQ
jgi:hypothetical protein